MDVRLTLQVEESVFERIQIILETTYRRRLGRLSLNSCSLLFDLSNVVRVVLDDIA